eukprot:scaffold72948_cov22-Prasinocladus_malaysianus.AAC.1
MHSLTTATNYVSACASPLFTRLCAPLLDMCTAFYLFLCLQFDLQRPARSEWTLDTQFLIALALGLEDVQIVNLHETKNSEAS